MSPRFYSNPDGTGLAGGLPCQAPSEGDQPFASSPSCSPSRKAAVAPAETCSAVPRGSCNGESALLGHSPPSRRRYLEKQKTGFQSSTI